MAVERAGEMGRPGVGIFPILMLSALLLSASEACAQDDGFSSVVIKNFKNPRYNELTKKLEFIVYGETAKTAGALVKMSDVKLEMIDANGLSVKSVISSPDADYDRVTETIKGDTDIHYRSAEIDIDGVGFDVDGKSGKIHVRSEVRGIIKAERPLFAKTRRTVGETGDGELAVAEISTETKADSGSASKEDKK